MFGVETCFKQSVEDKFIDDATIGPCEGLDEIWQEAPTLVDRKNLLVSRFLLPLFGAIEVQVWLFLRDSATLQYACLVCLRQQSVIQLNYEAFLSCLLVSVLF